jgi:hypothetical protein
VQVDVDGGTERRQPSAGDEQLAMLAERLTELKQAGYLGEVLAYLGQQQVGRRAEVAAGELIDRVLEPLRRLVAESFAAMRRPGTKASISSPVGAVGPTRTSAARAQPEARKAARRRGLRSADINPVQCRACARLDRSTTLGGIPTVVPTRYTAYPVGIPDVGLLGADHRAVLGDEVDGLTFLQLDTDDARGAFGWWERFAAA